MKQLLMLMLLLAPLLSIGQNLNSHPTAKTLKGQYFSFAGTTQFSIPADSLPRNLLLETIDEAVHIQIITAKDASGNPIDTNDGVWYCLDGHTLVAGQELRLYDGQGFFLNRFDAAGLRLRSLTGSAVGVRITYRSKQF